jgi:hypothetical protein
MTVFNPMRVAPKNALTDRSVIIGLRRRNR